MKEIYNTPLKYPSKHSQWILKLLSIALFSLLNNVELIKAQIQGVIGLNESFAQIQNFTNVYLQPDEMFSLRLDDYFRGNFPIYTNFVQESGTNSFEYFQDMIQITDPVVQVAREDFPLQENQMSLPQTSLIYTHPVTNKKYFIFIDFQMRLRIFDISDYFYYNGDNPNHKTPEVSTTDLYSLQFINATSRACTNLILLEDDLLLMNCLGRGNSQRAINVIINITNMQKVSATYFPTQKSFPALRDGKYVFFKKVTSVNELTQQVQNHYMVITKENRTTCYFDIEKFDGIREPVLVRRVVSFSEPPLFDWMVDWYEKNPIPQVDSCLQTQPLAMRLDEIRLDIPFLQVQDIEVVPFFDNIVISTDYNYGLMFLELKCDVPTHCRYTPISIIKESGLSEVHIMQNEGLIQEHILFAQRVNPPWLFEIKYETPSKPNVRRIYTIGGQEGDYISWGMVDANQDYVLCHLMSTMHQKPVFRVYKRSNSFFSIGLTEMMYTEFPDQGTFLKFISIQDNYILLKTSEYFSILKLQDQHLVINVTNYQSLQKRNLLDRSYDIVLFVRDVNHFSLETRMQFKMLSTREDIMKQTVIPTNMIVYQHALIKFTGVRPKGEKPLYTYYYNCGEMALKIDIDELFDGSKEDQIMLRDLNSHQATEQENELQGFFETSNYQFVQERQKFIPLTGCTMKTILENSNGDLMLQCLHFMGSQTYFVDLQDCNCTTPRVLHSITIDHASILEFNYDAELQEMFILSNKTSTGEEGAMIHLLKMYNLMAWESSVDLNEKYPELQNNFRFRTFNALTYQQIIQMGTIISEPRLVPGTQLSQSTLLIYDYEKVNSKSQVIIVAYLQILIDQSSGVTVQHSRIDRFGNIWVVLSNQTLNLYSQVPFKNENGRLDRLFFKKAFYFNADPILNPEDMFINMHLYSMSSRTDRFVLFFKRNKMLMLQHQRGSTDLHTLYYLPLYYADELEETQSVEYEFVINQFTNDITFAKYNNRLLFMLFKKLGVNRKNPQQTPLNLGYTLFIYDITKQKQGCLLYKQELPADVQIKQYFVRIELVESVGNTLEVYLFVDNNNMIQYRLDYKNELEISAMDRHRLMDLCQGSELSLIYDVFPKSSLLSKDTMESDIKNTASILVLAVNTGLTIQKVKPRDKITLTTEITYQQMQLQRRRGDTRNEGMRRRGFIFDEEMEAIRRQAFTSTTAQYSLLRMFSGHNLTYDLKCQRTEEDHPVEVAQAENQLLKWKNGSKNLYEQFEDDQDQSDPLIPNNCKSIVKLQDPTRTYNQVIEVLGNSANLLGFFVIDPAMIFFEQSNMIVYLPEIEHFQRVDLKKANFLFNNPERFFIKSVTQPDEQVVSFLMFQTDDNLFGAALVLSSLTQNKLPLYVQKEENYINVHDTFYLHKAEALMTVPWNILQTDIYLLPHPNPTTISIRCILAIHEPAILFNSIIRIYDLAFREPDYYPAYRLNTARILSINRLGLDFFIINSISMIGNSTLLAIGVENYGIVIYDIWTFSIVKYISLEQYYTISRVANDILDSHRLVINSIVAQVNQLMIIVIVNNNAVFSIRVMEGNNLDTIEIETVYMESTVPRNYIKEVAIGNIGYAFIQGTEDVREINEAMEYKFVRRGTPALKFFSYFGGFNTKNIGEIKLDINENCRYLQSIGANMTRRNFIPDLPDDSLTTASICGTTLRIRSMDLYPELVINVSNSRDQVFYQREVQVSSMNAYSNSENLTSQVILDIRILSSDREIHPLLYVLYILIPTVLYYLIIFASKERKKEQKSQAKKDGKNRDNSGKQSRGRQGLDRLDSMESSHYVRDTTDLNQSMMQIAPMDEEEREAQRESDRRNTERKYRQSYRMFA